MVENRVSQHDFFLEMADFLQKQPNRPKSTENRGFPLFRESPLHMYMRVSKQAIAHTKPVNYTKLLVL